jgi:hypothetical protein
MQVMLNLSHDPTTEQQTRAAMDENQIHMGHQLPRLLRDVVGDLLPADDPEATKYGNYIFGALRGMAIDQGHVRALPTTRVDPESQAEQRRMLVASLATYVESAIGKPDKNRGLLRSRGR